MTKKVKQQQPQQQQISSMGIRIPKGCSFLSGNQFNGYKLKIVDQDGCILSWYPKKEALSMINKQMAKYYPMVDNPKGDLKLRAGVSRLIDYAEYIKRKIVENQGIFMEEDTQRFIAP